MVTVDGVNFYQVLNAAKAAYEVDQLRGAIVNLTMTNIRTVMGSMDLDELLSNRDKINARLLQVVDAATEPWGVKVTRIEIKDIAPPRDLVDSMARQMKAEREKRAQILEAEGLRQAAILKAEGEKQAVVLAAEGRKEAAFRDAEARERSAEAEAKATEVVSEAIAKGNVQAINYFVANNYVKALEAIAKSPNQKILMMPLEASSVIGSLAGLAEITSEAFGRNGAGGAAGAEAERQPPAAAPGQRADQPAAACRLSVWGAIAMQILFRDCSSASGPGTGSSWPCCCSSSRPSFPACTSCGSASPPSSSASSALAAGIAWQWQLIAFGVISVLTVFWVRRYVAPDVAHQRPARPQRARPAVRRPLAGGRAGDPERPRQGARRRYPVDRRRPRRAGRRARHGHGSQGHRAGGGAC